MNDPKPKKKSGGQPGNMNHLKHGIYSHFIQVAEDAAQREMSEENFKDELMMARVCFSKAMQERTSATETKEKLGWDFACHYWFESIVSIKGRTLEHKRMDDEVWTTLLQAVRAANDRQKVKRWR
jgi:hypothetical protein